MRAREFRFYSGLAKVSGVLCILVGVVLPFVTVRRQRYYYSLAPIDWWFFYLAHGITLLIVSVLFSREHRLRKEMRR